MEEELEKVKKKKYLPKTQLQILTITLRFHHTIY